VKEGGQPETVPPPEGMGVEDQRDETHKTAWSVERGTRPRERGSASEPDEEQRDEKAPALGGSSPRRGVSVQRTRGDLRSPPMPHIAIAPWHKGVAREM
jgi:hypothetical protein